MFIRLYRDVSVPNSNRGVFKRPYPCHRVKTVFSRSTVCRYFGVSGWHTVF